VIIVRWVLVPFVSFIVFALVAALFLMSFSKLGGKASEAYVGAILFGTAFSIWAGTAVAPRRHWKIALYGLIAIINLSMVSIAGWEAFDGTISTLNVADVGMSAAGSSLVFKLLKTAYASRSSS
jgi:hypothetical protein